MELIEEGGVDAATTRAIAERAGVSVPSLYRFFADRNEILDRLVEHHIEGLDAHVAAQPPQVPGSLGEAMLIAMEAYASYWDENPGAARLWFEDTQTTTTGAVREFASPPLTPGTQYTYTVRATWTENGRDVTQTQQVGVTAGARVAVDFPVKPESTGQPSVTPTR